MGVQFRTVEFWYGVAFGLFVASAGAVMILAGFSLSTPEYWGAVATISAIPVTIFAALVPCWSPGTRWSRCGGRI
ncbi:hypothetical protein [Oceanicola sp. S124]|uniref:hypothetical protein n=1 Tax=Oceanicola sp. S124 TaxID=1042378 RepID=UPI00025596B5|nr:hypothetical protein [Oceanicola sp. S124]